MKDILKQLNAWLHVWLGLAIIVVWRGRKSKDKQKKRRCRHALDVVPGIA